MVRWVERTKVMNWSVSSNRKDEGGRKGTGQDRSESLPSRGNSLKEVPEWRWKWEQGPLEDLRGGQWG